MYGRKLNAYRKTNTAELSVADPYEITKMLFQGVFERLAQAKGAIARGDLDIKARTLSTATSILQNLRDTLDFSQNKTIAENLYDLYSYMMAQIAEASVKISCEPIDRALRILRPIKDAWDHIPPTARQEAFARRTTAQLAVQTANRDVSLAHGAI